MWQISQHDKSILRKLAEKKAALALLPIQQQRIEMWKKLNGLKKVKPLVLIKPSEIPWHEIGIFSQLETTGEFARKLELELRQLLYMWENLQCDMVIENKMTCQMVVYESGFGFEEVSDKLHTAPGSIASRHFQPQIKSEKDIEKIKTPMVSLDKEATLIKFEIMQDVFGDILPVELYGAKMFWFVPWDYLVTLWGAQELLLDMAMRPEMVKAVIDKMVNAQLSRLEQWEKLNALSLNNDGTIFGSGGYCFTDELPKKDFNNAHVRAADTWGSCAAQIFSEVSPQMHMEFAIDFEVKWLSQFGLTTYGCCEPLHNKIGILKKIPNLRRISVSPWANFEKAVSEIKSNYVISYKPNPAVFAFDKWDSDTVAKELREKLKTAQDCCIEIIMKDVSTIKNDPARLTDWAKIAWRIAEEFA